MVMKKSGSAAKAPKKKVPNIALHLPRQAQALYLYCLAVWAKVKADTVHFPTPFPPAAQIDGDLTALGNALPKAEGGSPADTAALQSAADKVHHDFVVLGAYLDGVLRTLPVEDVAAIIASLLLQESKAGAKPPKPPLAVKDGDGTGIVVLAALAVFHAMRYEWETSVDQVTWTAAPATAQAHTTLTGLTPAKTYYFRFRCFLRDNTTTDYSQVISHIVR